MCGSVALFCLCFGSAASVSVDRGFFDGYLNVLVDFKHNGVCGIVYLADSSVNAACGYHLVANAEVLAELFYLFLLF